MRHLIGLYSGSEMSSEIHIETETYSQPWGAPLCPWRSREELGSVLCYLWKGLVETAMTGHQQSLITEEAVVLYHIQDPKQGQDSRDLSGK